MIKERCFTGEWLDAFKKQRKHSKIDTGILEKMIYALHLVEQLKEEGLDFVFKGGTSLVLLLQEGNRFSIDIDIICSTNRDELEAVLQSVVDSSHFLSFQLDEHRSYKVGVPKAHYSFEFNSVAKGKYTGNILLDVLIEESLYPELIDLPVQTKWIETEGETLVTCPTIESITGDKLTAFAPNTIGIPYFKGKDRQPFSMEICKQLFDLGRLFGKIENLEIVRDSFQAFAKKEIEYRKGEFTPDGVLKDTIDTCLILAKRGKGDSNEKDKFAELQKGIKAFGSGFLMEGNFRIDDAIPVAARVAYLAAKLYRNDMTPLEFYNGQDVKGYSIEHPKWGYLNKLQRQPDKSSFYYWYKTIELLE